MKKKGKKVWIVLGAIAVVLVVLVFVLPMLQPKADLSAMYKTHKVQKGEFKVSIQGTGNIVSSNDKEVILSQAGKVENLTVKDGDRVEQGQTLFHVYNESLEDSISSTEDSIAQQQINASKLSTQLSSFKYYAPIDGYVYNLKANVGDDAANIAKAYGSICQIVPNTNVQLKCNASYSIWNVIDRALTINQTVYVLSRYNAGREPTAARVSGIVGTTFTVEIPVNFGNIGTLVDVYSTKDTTVYNKLGEGTVTYVDPILITGSGKVSKIYVKENQQVKKGDLILEFDSSEVQKNIQSYQITIDGLKDTLEKNQNKVADSTVVAPIGGVISGLTAVEGANVTAGQLVAKIVDTGAQEIVIQVDELDVPKVKVGQSATVTIDALLNQEFKGTVSKIAELGTVANSITTYDVTISVADTTGIKIGMSATAEILVEQRDGIIMVPVSYIENFNGKKRVRVIPAGVDLKDIKTWKQGENGMPVPFEWREITVGSSNANEYEVLSGLQEGDVVTMLAVTQSDNMSMFGGGRREENSDNSKNRNSAREDKPEDFNEGGGSSDN